MCTRHSSKSNTNTINSGNKPQTRVSCTIAEAETHTRLNYGSTDNVTIMNYLILIMLNTTALTYDTANSYCLNKA